MIEELIGKDEESIIIVDNVHSIIEKNNESLVFTLFCDESFLIKKLYAELRSNPAENRGILYYLITGRMNDENGLFRTIQKKSSEDKETRRLNYMDALRQFDFVTLLKKEEVTEPDFKNIISLLKANPLPDITDNVSGLDGYWIVFQNYIACNATYKYWIPPQGYKHLQEITNIVSNYLPEKYRKYLYI